MKGFLPDQWWKKKTSEHWFNLGPRHQGTRLPEQPVGRGRVGDEVGDEVTMWNLQQLFMQLQYNTHFSNQLRLLLHLRRHLQEVRSGASYGCTGECSPHQPSHSSTTSRISGSSTWLRNVGRKSHLGKLDEWKTLIPPEDKSEMEWIESNDEDSEKNQMTMMMMKRKTWIQIKKKIQETMLH
ncbi:hypothetical protein Pcinc_039379 [Petrolisthes cinctipes]|uniref:Uncharacterized protein n=1 Tax=Petrolisthes cinctipes TaxID=88211 RepID=A0AAE1BNN2_PETCI|nr:hypothetical protein Pcinc_039379 [Petrolisthes cinctipes]